MADSDIFVVSKDKALKRITKANVKETLGINANETRIDTAEDDITQLELDLADAELDIANNESAIVALQAKDVVLENQTVKNSSDIKNVNEVIAKLATTEDSITDNGIASVAISKQALSGACKVVKSGKSFTNKIINGNFETGVFSPWSIPSGISSVEGNYGFREVTNYLSAAYTITQNIDLIVGHVYCIISKAIVKSLSTGTALLSVFRNGDLASLLSVEVNEEVILKEVFTAVAETGSIGIGCRPSIADSGTLKFGLSSYRLFDLTAEGHTSLTADEVLAYNPIYHDGVAHTDGKGCLLSKNEDETISNKFFYDNLRGVLRSNTETYDTLEDVNDVLTDVQRVDADGLTLAEPIYTPIPTVGLLQAYQAGATFDLPQDKILFKYDGNPVSATGITSLLELSEYDPVNNIETTLDASLATIGADSFTHPSLVLDTWYIAEYEYSREVEGDIDIISRNNEKYKIDTVTSDLYKVEIIVTNGIPSLQATLV